MLARPGSAKPGMAALQSQKGSMCYNESLISQEILGMAEFPLIENTQFEPEDEYRPEPEPEPQPPAWMDGSLRIGIHTSIAGSYLNALESAKKLGGNALQIFSASPRMWQGAAARIPESGREGVSRAAGRVGAGAAGDPCELPGESGGDAADAADAVDPGVS